MAQINVFYHYDNQTGKHIADAASAIMDAVQGYTEAQLIEVNEGGGLKLWVVPRYNNRRHYAWNPIVFRSYHAVFDVGDWSVIPAGVDKTPVTVDGSPYICYMLPDGTDTVELPLYDNLGQLMTTLTASELNGEAVFNVAPVVRTLFGERPLPGDAQSRYVRADPYLATTFQTKGLDGDMTGRVYLIQNAVAQAGDDGDKSFGTALLLNDNTEMMRYYVYDSADENERPEATILVQLNSSIEISTGVFPLVAGNAYRIPIFEPEDAVAVNDYLDTYGTGQQHVTFREVSCNPAIVRWVNRKGGIDTYVFERRQTKTKTAKTTGTKSLYLLSTADHTGNRQAYAVEGERSITVGSDGVSGAVLDFLTRLPYSPYIEWYEEDDYQWTQVTVQEFKNEERTDSPSHAYEVTLLCPAINMQF